MEILDDLEDQPSLFLNAAHQHGYLGKSELPSRRQAPLTRDQLELFVVERRDDQRLENSLSLDGRAQPVEFAQVLAWLRVVAVNPRRMDQQKTDGVRAPVQRLKA